MVAIGLLRIPVHITVMFMKIMIMTWSLIIFSKRSNDHLSKSLPLIAIII